MRWITGVFDVIWNPIPLEQAPFNPLRMLTDAFQAVGKSLPELHVYSGHNSIRAFQDGRVNLPQFGLLVFSRNGV